MTADHRERQHARLTGAGRHLGAALASLAFPALLLAQQPEGRPGTHQVREGDTLWDIARTYLGDPFLWPEIYRLNTDIVEDPHWIFPGEILRLPGAPGVPVPVATGEPAEPPAGQVVAPEEPMVVATGPTVFSQRRGTGGRRMARREVLGRTPAPSIRAGEILAAPWVDREGGPREFGRLISSTSQSIVVDPGLKTPLPVQERVLLLPPGGVVPERGERYLVVERGPVLDFVGQLMIPTGVVEVETPRSGEASTARIVQNFGEVRMSQLLLPMSAVPTVTGTARAAAVETGPQARVMWVNNDATLPSLQHYLILDATERDGVKLGDQFTLMRRAQRIEGDIRLSAEDIAVAQVVRVTPYGSTAIVIGQEHPAITEGMHARVTARLP